MRVFFFNFQENSGRRQSYGSSTIEDSLPIHSEIQADVHGDPCNLSEPKAKLSLPINKDQGDSVC